MQIASLEPKSPKSPKSKICRVPTSGSHPRVAGEASWDQWCEHRCWAAVPLGFCCVKHAAWSTVHLEMGDLEVAYSTSLRDDLGEELSFLGRKHFQSDARYSHGPPKFRVGIWLFGGNGLKFLLVPRWNSGVLSCQRLPVRMHFGLFGRWTALGMHFGWEWTLTRGKDWVAGNGDLWPFSVWNFPIVWSKATWIN